MVKTGKVEKKTKRGKVNFTIKHFPCSFCEKTFTDRYGRDYHMQLHSSEKPFSCKICSSTYKTKKYLARHVKNVHQPPSNYQCKYCDRKFHYKCKMEDHLAVHTNSKPHKCKVCGKGFNSTYSLATHVLIHKNLKPFKCSYCDYACRDSSTLRRHHDRHKGVVQRFPCEICGNTFSKKHILNEHVTEIHMEIDLKTVPCAQCDKRFKSERLMSIHVRDVHEKVYMTSCEICGLKLSRKYNMDSHLRTHVDAKPFKCAFNGCTKSYKDPSSLKKHSMVHYPEKQFPCPVCGRRFTRKIRMLRHVEVHTTRVKTLQCDYCGAKFLHKCNLSIHIRRMHMQRRPRYICDMCDYEAGNKAGIILHIRGHYRTADKTCYICEKSYKDEKWLKHHLWQAHNIVQSNGTPAPDKEIKSEPLDVDGLPQFELFEIEKEELLEELISINNETGEGNVDRNTQNSSDLNETQAIASKDMDTLHKALQQATEQYTASIPDGKLTDKDCDDVVERCEGNNEDSVTGLEDTDRVRHLEQFDDVSVGEKQVRRDSIFKVTGKKSDKNVVNEELKVNNGAAIDVENDDIVVLNKSYSDRENNDEQCRRNKTDSLDTGESSDVLPGNEEHSPNDSSTDIIYRNSIVTENDQITPPYRKISIRDTVNVSELERENKERKRRELDSENAKDCDGKIKKIKTGSEISDTRNNKERINNTELNSMKSHTNIDKGINSNADIKKKKGKIKNAEVISKIQHNPTYIVSFEDTDELVRKKLPKPRPLELQQIENKKNQKHRKTLEDNQVQNPEKSIKINDKKQTVQGVSSINNDLERFSNNNNVNNSRELKAITSHNDEQNYDNTEKLKRNITNNDGHINDNRRKPKRITSTNDDDNINDNRRRLKRVFNTNDDKNLNDNRRRLKRIFTNDDKKINDKKRIERVCIKDNLKSRRYSDDEDATLEYSRSVLSEDLTRCLSWKTKNPSEKEFDDFAMENMFGRVKNKDKIIELDKDSQSYAKRCLDKLLKETREKKEIKLLEKARQQYNERILRAKGMRKEKVAIKYYGKMNKNDDREKNDNDDSNNEKDLRITESEDGNSKVFSESVDENINNISNDNTDVIQDIDSKLHKEKDGMEALDKDVDTKTISVEGESNTDCRGGKETDTRLRPASTRKRKIKCYKDFITNEGRNKNVDESLKIKINTHQCYVCFKLYDTKAKLLDHCKDHFEICNSTILKKCPLCDFATKKSITRHMRVVHDMDITIPNFQIREKEYCNDGSKYFLKVNSSRLQDIDIIPSVKHLNKQACMDLDKKNRNLKDSGIAKTRLVKKGKEWIVERKTTTLDNVDDLILPQFEVDEILSVKIDSNDYLSRLKKLSWLAKRYEKKMVFPCEDCDKICVNFAALKLHSRRHDKNAKPFKKKVWKHKLKDMVVPKFNTVDTKKSRRVVEIDTIDKEEKIDEVNTNRYEKPRPVKNKHKCDPELIKFYETNVKGGDIEFWQFLKIFNKMSKENVNDFEDLVDKPEFGIHIDPGNNVSDKNIDTNDIVTNKTISKTSIVNKSLKNTINKDSGKFKRVIRISKKEHKRRNVLKQQLRERIAKENVT